MNAISYVVNNVKHSIPSDILSVVFTNPHRNTTLDDNIYNDVIKGRMLTDLNVTGGIMITLPLSSCIQVSYTYNYIVYRVPPELRDGKPIMSVLSVIYSMPFMRNVFNSLQDAYLDKLDMRSTGVPMHSSSRVEVLSDDTIMIHDSITNIDQYSIRLLVANDPYLNNIHPRLYLELSKLGLLAVKAYIYNNLNLIIDKGYIQNGHRLESMHRIVESYSNANEQYMEVLNRDWYKLQYMNRAESMKRHVSYMIPNDL